MSEDHAHVAALAVLPREPRFERRADVPGAALHLELDAPVARADPQPRERVDGESQAVHPPQRVAPRVRLIAVHLVEQSARVFPQRGFHFARQRDGGVGGPLRHEACVHEQRLASGVEMSERPGQQPFEQRVAIRRAEHVFDRVPRLDLALRRERDGEQMQIVIAEHRDGVVAERAHVAQCFQGTRAAIHEIAREPELVAIRAEAELCHESAQLVMTTLDVADRPRRHG